MIKIWEKNKVDLGKLERSLKFLNKMIRDLTLIMAFYLSLKGDGL